MINSGFIGGRFGYQLLRRLGRDAAAGKGYCSGSSYAGLSKLEVLFGPGIWQALRGRLALDFGCGAGEQVIEMAEHGAGRAVGLDIRQKLLDTGTAAARAAGVAGLCEFVTQTQGKFDLIFSVDGFEHYEDPAAVLDALRHLLRADGRVYLSFGPPWLHPFGGHLFSVFPWAHLLFTEQALLRWRADFKSDGATHFHEVEGGLNQMTIGRFQRLLRASDFDLESLELVPMRRLRHLSNPLTREFFTAMVRAVLLPRTRHTLTA